MKQASDIPGLKPKDLRQIGYNALILPVNIDLSWWQANDGADPLRRFISDLIIDEVKRLRKYAGLPLDLTRILTTQPDCHLMADLGSDSLELMQVSARLVQALHLSEHPEQTALLQTPFLADWLAAARHGLTHGSGKITFMTSGSSGRPKSCTHATSTLVEEMHHVTTLLSPRQRIVSAVPCHHIYGFLFTVLLPILSAPTAVPVFDVRTYSPAVLFRMLQPGDLVVAYPEFWQAALASGTTIPDNVEGITSTAPCPPTLAQALRGVGLKRLWQIYGSSETAGIGWRCHENDDYQLFPFWQPAERPHTLARAFNGQPWTVTLQDHLQWSDATRFKPTGRRDGMVQVGGVNVSPYKVRDILLQHPGVQDVAVRLMHDATHETPNTTPALPTSNRLKAFVVPRADITDLRGLETALLVWAQQHLSSAEQPRSYRYGPNLPKSEMGKSMDWDL